MRSPKARSTRFDERVKSRRIQPFLGKIDGQVVDLPRQLLKPVRIAREQVLIPLIVGTGNVALGSDGLRGELTLLRAARALAAYRGHGRVTRKHLRDVAPLALSHRLRRDPLDEAGSGARVARIVETVLG